ncbi:Apolipoprotein N-acyltransferase [bacterium HR36]|nr:Apolipoprotein N-acyltransferase [bacterium HR36]
MDWWLLIVGLLAILGASVPTWLGRETMQRSHSDTSDESSAAKEGARTRQRIGWPLALLSGLLLWLAYFPANWGWLAWIALVPWLASLRIGSPHTSGSSFAAGLLFGVLALQWIRLGHPLMYLAWLGLALVLGLHWWLFALIVRQIVSTGRWPMPLVAPLAWVSLEWVRARVDIGFAWYFLGHTQHNGLPHLGLVCVTGAYGVSALVMLVNVVLAEILVQSMRHAGSAAVPGEQTPVRLKLLAHIDAVLWCAGCLALLLANPVLAARWRTAFPQTGAVRVLVMQPSEPQQVRNAPSEERQRKTLAAFRELVRQAARQLHESGKVELVVWPETSMPFDWVQVVKSNYEEIPNLVHTHQSSPKDVTLAEAEQLQRIVEGLLGELARLLPAHLVVGVNSKIYFALQDSMAAADEETSKPLGQLRYNSALLVSPKGQVSGRYDKIYRIPFGEYLPLRHWLPWIVWFSPYESEYSIAPGEAAKTLTFGEGGWRMGVLICYEDTVPHLPRQFFRDASGPDFFVNISNDGWFQGSEEHEQHLAIARFRAAETRRALIRSVNMGVSAVIDGDGAIIALPGTSWHDSKARPAVFVAEVPVYTGQTVYVRYGDWFAWTCLALTAGLLVPSLALRVLRRQSRADGSG